MKPTDVVLIDLPEVLTDIVEAILERDPGVRVTAQLDSGGRLTAAVGERRADVAIVGGDGQLRAEQVIELLCARPAVRVVTVGGDGREGSLHELCPRVTPLGELSPAALLEAVKAAGKRGCAELAARSAPAPEGGL